ncbi:MAG: hypothetical protein JWM82_1201 [Myxococcales bacterium]|nr:hypothetical protein [Myxococcales bacterium]
MNDDLVSVGYLLLRPLERTSFFSALVPRSITSASPCLCPRFPGIYAIDWSSTPEDERGEAFVKIGIPPADQPAARAWATRAFDDDFGWPGVFYSRDAALEARRTFLSRVGDARVIGVGLSKDALDAFLESAAPQPIGGDTAGVETGAFTAAKRREALAPGGRRLGFELLNIELGEPHHSWSCNNLQDHFLTALGVRPNAEGFIDGLADAQRCCAELASGKVGAEPGPWLPFALVAYEA